MKAKLWLKNLFKLTDFRWQNCLVFLVSGTINAVGVAIFLIPAQLIDGGFSGLSYFISTLTPLTASMYLLIFNIPIYFFGLKKMGFTFIIYSMIAMLTYALMLFLFQDVLNIQCLVLNNYLASLENPDILRVPDIILCSIFGGILSGIGSGLTMRYNGTLDGLEVLAVYFHKKIGLTIGQFELIFNSLVFIVAGIVTRSFEIPLYSLLAYYINTKTIDFVIEGFNRSKAMNIITSKGNEVAQVLSEKLGQGLTITEGKGFFAQEKKEVIYFIVTRFQISKAKEIVRQIDKDAFITVTDVSEVIHRFSD